MTRYLFVSRLFTAAFVTTTLAGAALLAARPTLAQGNPVAADAGASTPAAAVAATVEATVNPSAPAAAASAADCTAVEVHNVRPQLGHLMLAAYIDAGSYGEKPLQALRVPAGDAVTRLAVCGLSGTEVALMLFQDLNSDSRMGRNLVGMPTEPWGSSGTPGAFGPAWDTGRVPLDGKAIVVRLVH